MWLFTAKSVTLSCEFYNVGRYNTYNNYNLKYGKMEGKWTYTLQYFFFLLFNTT